jgi:hypothetical protein
MLLLHPMEDCLFHAVSILRGYVFAGFGRGNLPSLYLIAISQAETTLR